jgi:hypothetical protein
VLCWCSVITQTCCWQDIAAYCEPALQTPLYGDGLRCLQELVHQHSVFKLLGQASSRALQLMMKATSNERSKPALLRVYMKLQLLLSSFMAAWGCCKGALTAEEAAAGKQLAQQQLQETGVQQRCFG